DNIQAFAKSLDGSVDDVARGASRQASKVSDNFADDVADVIVRKGEDVPRLKEVEVEFNRNPKHDKAEFTRQLADQEAGMNQLTVQEYLDNRERYIADGRALEGNAAQQAARKEAFEDKLEELINANMPIDKAEQEAQKWLDTQ
uniref:polymorphic toxin type 15 domain-containing protein n=1 Tax=Streptococcus suis TaxID=1307 RepID=UPI00192DCCC0